MLWNFLVSVGSVNKSEVKYFNGIHMKALFGLVGVVLVSGLGWFLLQRSETEPGMVTEGGTKVSVVATFYPLADFARNVGGSFVDVISVVPAGVEPHEYEPTPQDILRAYEADIFLINGAGFDAWAEKIRPELEARGVKVIQMSELVTLLPGSHEEHEEHEEHEAEGGMREEEHEEGEFDPHFWLDPVLAEKQVETIAAALGERDTPHQTEYMKQSGAYLSKLQALDATYRASMESCRLDTVVTSHNAFAYLAKRYGFMTLSVAGLSPEAEASPRHLAEVATLVKQKGIQHIFFETLVSPKVAETLAQEVGATTLVFNPIEGITDEERLAGMDYLAIMKSNLESLKIARQCQ